MARKIRPMFVLIVGAGRVGSSLARRMLAEGHEVSCLDEDPESHARLEIGLDKPWEDLGGHFTVGTALEVEALTAAGIERADVFVASTDGDNTNIVIAQMAKRRFGVPKVIARILDPYRAKWYADQGLDTICPTRVAIEMLEQEILEQRREPASARRPAPSTTRTRTSSPMAERQYIIIVGAGKVGWNLARELIEKGNEVTLIESNRERYLTVEQELEHNIQYGDASELWVLERAGISRADMVIAVTGDDEDNMLICQVAKEKYLVDRIIARVNNPRNRETFDLLGIKPVVSATDLILRLIEHEVPEYGLVHLLDLPEQRLEIIEMELPADSKAAGRRVGDLAMPEGSLLISVLREGTGFVPNSETVLQAGDEILAVLDPRVEEDLTAYFGPDGSSPDERVGAGVADRDVDFLIVGGGLAAAYCASELRKQGAEGSILLAGTRAGAAVRAPTAVEGVSARRGLARRRIRQPGRLVRGERGRAAHANERDGARPGGADGDAPGRGGGRVRVGADRHRRERQHPPTRGRRARGNPLPARVRQLGRDPRAGRGGRSAWSSSAAATSAARSPPRCAPAGPR